MREEGWPRWTYASLRSHDAGILLVPKGHVNRLGLVPHRAIKGTPHLVPDGFDRSQSVAVPIGAGGCILHHSQTVHWSPGNESPRWRRAFVVHYVRSDARMGARHPNSPPLPEMRGG